MVSPLSSLTGRAVGQKQQPRRPVAVAVQARIRIYATRKAKLLLPTGQAAVARLQERRASTLGGGVRGKRALGTARLETLPKSRSAICPARFRGGSCGNSAGRLPASSAHGDRGLLVLFLIPRRRRRKGGGKKGLQTAREGRASFFHFPACSFTRLFISYVA